MSFEIGYFLVAEAAEVAQQDQLAVLRPQTVDHVPQLRCQSGVLEVAEGIFVVVSHHHLDLIAIRVRPMQRNGLQPPTPQLVDAEVVGDSEEPRRKAVAWIEALEGRPGPHEGLL